MTIFAILICQLSVSYQGQTNGERTADWVENTAAETGNVTLKNPSHNAGPSMVNSSVVVSSAVVPLCSNPYSSNNEVNNVVSQSTSFIRPSIGVKVAAASN